MSAFSSNLVRRVLTGLVGIPLLLLAFFKAPLWVGVAVVAAAALIGAGEFFALLSARGLRPFRAVGYLAVAGAFVDTAAREPGAPGPWPAAVLLVLCAALLAARPRQPLAAAAAAAPAEPPGPHTLAAIVPAAAGTLLGALYLGTLAGCMAALHALPPAGEGPWRVLLLLAIIMSSDTMAFFTGHAWGRHKLAPGISPGKTIEGALGGLLGGVLGAVLVARKLASVSLPHAVALGLVTAGLGIAGDLVESLLKRWAGVKDSGALFPGHGGMLDRLDSLLFGAGVLYYYFLLRG